MLYYMAYLRGHVQSLQVVVAKSFPVHGLPPSVGVGLLHCLFRVVEPPSHILVHSPHGPQYPHSPSPETRDSDATTTTTTTTTTIDACLVKVV